MLSSSSKKLYRPVIEGNVKLAQTSRFLLKCFNILILADDDQNNKPEVLNSKAVAVINRVSNKLTGRDFKPNQTLDVKTQVDKLILQATSLEHLCRCYIGWCAFW